MSLRTASVFLGSIPPIGKGATASKHKALQSGSIFMSGLDSRFRGNDMISDLLSDSQYGGSGPRFLTQSQENRSERLGGTEILICCSISFLHVVHI